MRVFHVICLTTAFRAIFAIPVDRLKDSQIEEDGGVARRFGRPPYELDAKSASFPSPYSAVLERNKREDNNEREESGPFPARHAKHRRRRRCKNRVTCSRVGTSAKQHFPAQNNETSAETTAKNTGELTDWNFLQESRTTVKEDAQDFVSKAFLDVEDDNSYERDQTYFTDNKMKELNGVIKQETTTVTVDFSSTLLDEGHTLEKLEESMATDERLVDDWRDDFFEISSVPSWIHEEDNRRSKGNGMRFPSIYMAIDEQVPLHEGLATLLTRLFQTFRNASTEDSQDLLKGLNLVDTLDEDPCQKWLNSKDKFERAFLGPSVRLPSCPCHYPSSIFYDDKIWDEQQQRHFRWRDVSGESQRLDVYKPGAVYCVRSLLTQGSRSAAAQHCCYDRQRKLLTRGSGAGTPNFVSPEISAILHEKIDVLPWRLCKGDFSRFNKVRPPNNDNNCDANPDDEEYRRQIDNTKYY